MMYLFTIDQNGNIIENVEIDSCQTVSDVKLANNKIMAIFDDKLIIFDF